MTIEADILDVLKVANITAYYKAAPEYEKGTFTVLRRLETEPLPTLLGPSGWRRSDFAFDTWAESQTAAIAQRDAVAAAIVGALTSLPTAFEIGPGESAYDPDVNKHMEPCAFSFWHE